MNDVKEVSEKDKPFILALVSAGIFLVGVTFSVISNKWDFIKDWAVISTPYMSMSWAWYFKSKSE